MKLHYYKPADNSSNFGDSLNVPLWNHYFPNCFNSDENEVFIGIGTVLRVINKKYYGSNKVIVFGAGAHCRKIELPKNVIFKFVRGPLTVNAIGGKNIKFITDPAIVTPLVFPQKNIEKKYKYSYIPHYSVDNENNKDNFERLGIHYISPRESIESIILQINQTEVLLAEAMHGAIVSDAYRIPWIPVYSYKSFNFFKWKDWTLSQGIDIKFNRILRLYQSETKIKIFIKRVIIGFQLWRIKKIRPYLSEDMVHIENTNEILNEISDIQAQYFNKSSIE